MIICSVDGCGKKHLAKGLCGLHWSRQYNGRPLEYVTMFQKSPMERFLEKVDVRGSEDCWLWLGGRRGRNGFEYGSAWHQGKNIGAHQLSWILHKGFLPTHIGLEKAEVCHKCDTPLCVNPEHLFIGTRSDNMRDKVSKGRDNCASKPFCKHGHERTSENLYTDKRGLRQCKVCHRIRESQRREKLKEKQNGTRSF